MPSPSSFSSPVWKMLDELASKNPNISEIIFNSEDKVFVESEGFFTKLNVKIDSKTIHSFVDEIARFNDKSCDRLNPILDGIMPDGSRVNIIVEPFAKDYPAITIRKYNQTLKDFVPGVFGLSEKWIHFLKALVQSKMNIVVSGGTGAGKTTFLNLLIKYFGAEERIITIEDTIELNVEHLNQVRLEAITASTSDRKAITTRDLVKNTLRMRPDRIIIGECRGPEVFDLLQAMNTGHEGSMTSLHANSAQECLKRIETLYLLSGFEIPVRALRSQVATAVDFIIQVNRDKSGKRRVETITEVSGMEGDQILLQNLGIIENNKLIPTGLVPSRLNQLGIEKDFFNTSFED